MPICARLQGRPEGSTSRSREKGSPFLPFSRTALRDSLPAQACRPRDLNPPSGTTLEAGDQKRADRARDTESDEHAHRNPTSPCGHRDANYARSQCSESDDQRPDGGCARSKGKRRAHLHSVAGLRPLSDEEDHEAEDASNQEGPERAAEFKRRPSARPPRPDASLGRRRKFLTRQDRRLPTRLVPARSAASAKPRRRSPRRRSN
jgi:hypothetical protein